MERHTSKIHSKRDAQEQSQQALTIPAQLQRGTSRPTITNLVRATSVGKNLTLGSFRGGLQPLQRGPSQPNSARGEQQPPASAVANSPTVAVAIPAININDLRAAQEQRREERLRQVRIQLRGRALTSTDQMEGEEGDVETRTEENSQRYPITTLEAIIRSSSLLGLHHHGSPLSDPPSSH